MNKKHRQTLIKIFEKPDHSDIKWADTEGLFTALGAEICEKSVRRFLQEAGVGT